MHKIFLTLGLFVFIGYVTIEDLRSGESVLIAQPQNYTPPVEANIVPVNKEQSVTQKEPILTVRESTKELLLDTPTSELRIETSPSAKVSDMFNPKLEKTPLPNLTSGSVESPTDIISNSQISDDDNATGTNTRNSVTITEISDNVKLTGAYDTGETNSERIFSDKKVSATIEVAF